MHVGEATAIVAAAYINSYGKPEKTKMFDIDSTIVAVIQQVSPNDGTLARLANWALKPPLRITLLTCRPTPRWKTWHGW